MKDIAGVFSAIDSAIPRLEEYYRTPSGYGTKGPYFLCYTIEYQDCICKNQWLFSAKQSDDKDVSVKFVPGRYGEEVHQLLASNGLAPKLKYTAMLPGGWVAIVMEKIVNGKMLIMLEKPLTAEVQ